MAHSPCRTNHHTNHRAGYRIGSLCLSLCLIVLPGPGYSQPAKTGLREVQATMENMGEGGLFFPGSSPGTVLAGQQVAATVDIDISGMVARATVTQHFANPRDEWVEALYVFPLPETSAVDRLQLTVGERVIKAEIAERKQAELKFEEAKAAGKTASMLSQERPNIFTNAVTNIGPHETVSVQIGFDLPVDYHYDAETGPRFSIRFPMAIMPRYMPGNPVAALQASYTDQGEGWSFDTDQVPDASRISPPVDPERGLTPIGFNIDLQAGFPVGDLKSSYHTINTQAGETGFDITLADGVVPADRDFELTWMPANGIAPQAGIFSETVDGHDHHLVVISPPVPGDDDAATEIDMPRDVVFILDKSGSMSGTSMRQAKAAMERALQGLSPKDSFQIIAFDDSYYPLFHEARPAIQANIDDALDWLGRMEAGGGTEMAGALTHALSGDGEVASGRLGQVIFITDGAVGNEDALFRMIESNLGDRRLFTVGIGSAPNGYFMREAATAGRGTYTFIGALDQVGERMATLFRQLESPELTNLTASLPAGAEMYPPLLPDLYQGEPVSFVLRLPEGTDGDITLTGSHMQTPWTKSLHIGADTAERPGVAALWARRKIAEIERVGRRQFRSSSNESDIDSIAKSVTRVALTYSLLSKYTSLLAVDDVARRPQEATLTSGSVAGNMPAGATMASPSMASAAAQPIRALTPLAAPHNPFSAQNLPRTATPADLLAMIGSILMVLGLMILWLKRRGEYLREQGTGA